MEHIKITGIDFYNMVVNGSNSLEEKKDFVNALNVFPVPDGDTGTNMSMTFKSAVNEIKDSKEETIGQIAKKLSKGALMGARGNSGVILSQIFRGIAKGLEGKEVVGSNELANAILEGSKSAYKAVMRPTEGTILTIIRAAAESAVKYEGEDISYLMKEVCDYSEIILNKTPEMLPVLKKAKVVDAGGMGLLIILKGMYEALEKNLSVEISTGNSNSASKEVIQSYQNEEIKFGYCTEFFIVAKDVNINDFKSELEPLGDSMIVVSADDIVKVHIHTNDPGLILSKAIKLGALSKIKIDNMREQHKHILDMEKETPDDEEIEESKKYGFVAVALGDGIKDIFKDLGVDQVIEGGQTMNPSTQDIVEAINKINAENIFVLPNNKNIIMASTQAAELSDKNIIVIPTKTIPQGITSITMFNPDVEYEENETNMKESIDVVSSASITYAVRDTEMDGKVIKEGNILGLVEGKIKEVGEDVFEVCDSLIDTMANEESELISIYYGKDCDETKVKEFVSKLEEKYEDIDIQCYNGKQPLYYFILSVE